ncbi:MAG: substrate-binding domain-containing protein [Coriobacteriales bacterium]|jgi:phosphate transport system substrate-binding protein|nr:substrate-binding domain-containing protein [Coriobacteriales bacterium]
MKKFAIIVSCLMLLVPLLFFGSYAAGRLFSSGRYLSGVPDKTADYSINVELKRASDWQRLVTEPVISESEFALVDGSTATVPITAELLRQFYGYSDEQVANSPFIWHSTTDRAYQYLADETGRYLDGEHPERVRLILVTPPSAEESGYAAQAGITFEQDAIALDGFVFIVNRDNPIDSLTLEQVRDIFSGAVTNWSQVGGDNQEIQAFQREEGSGSQTAMQQLVMKGEPMATPPQIASVSSMSGLVERVAEYQNGTGSIGYTFDYYVKNLYTNENIKVLKIDGVTPSATSYLDGSYPLTSAYYAIIRSDEPADSPARRLRDFLLSDTGRQVIELAGYTAVPPEWVEGRL